MDKVIITTFTDPMMGLSYECEPIFRKLETHYADNIEFDYVMAGLVRDVSDFMTQEELAQETEKGIRRYCRRLAGIYKKEESISGMPINMDGFHLFDEEHRSSYPLDIAYEAVKLAAPEKAEQFLYLLRYATIVETRQTTAEEEILRVVQKAGIDKDVFLSCYHGGRAEDAFLTDLKKTRSLGIYGLPAYIISCGERKVMVNSLIGYDTFTELIRRVSGGNVQPEKPLLSMQALETLLRKHPLISLQELCMAFEASQQEIRSAMKPMTECGEVSFDGNFYQREA